MEPATLTFHFKTWMHPGCITRPMDSERHVFIPAAASVHDPTLQGLQTSRLWGMVRWSRTAGQGLPFPWTQDKGGSSLNPREMLVRPSTATARGLSPTPSFYGRKLEPQPGPKLKLEAQQAYVNFTLISYVPNFFFLSLFVVLTNDLPQRRVVWMWFGALHGAFGLGRAQPQRRGTSP